MAVPIVLLALSFVDLGRATVSHADVFQRVFFFHFLILVYPGGHTENQCRPSRSWKHIQNKFYIEKKTDEFFHIHVSLCFTL